MIYLQKKRTHFSTIFLRRVNDTLLIFLGVTMRRVNDTLFIINGVIDASLHWGTVLFYGITPCRDASIIWFGDLFTKKRVHFSTIFLRRVNDTLFIINGVIDASLHWGTVLSYGIPP